PVKIPIPELLIRLRQEAFSAPVAQPALRGQGAGHRPLMSAIWRVWAAIYSSPLAYRAVSWLGSRFHWLTPAQQGNWTRVRAPLQPAARRLRDRLKDRA
ncbi:MAG: DUF3390 domain-containing protein, partial [Azonexus sp.]|nr:DUF3390 domain-containing protein [Azonexus sp.]